MISNPDRLPRATLHVLSGASRFSAFFDATELTRLIEQAGRVQHT